MPDDAVNPQDIDDDLLPEAWTLAMGGVEYGSTLGIYRYMFGGVDLLSCIAEFESDEWSKWVERILGKESSAPLAHEIIERLLEIEADNYAEGSEPDDDVLLSVIPSGTAPVFRQGLQDWIEKNRSAMTA
jgi:hypothetical protein